MADNDNQDEDQGMPPPPPFVQPVRPQPIFPPGEAEVPISTSSVLNTYLIARIRLNLGDAFLAHLYLDCYNRHRQHPVISSLIHAEVMLRGSPLLNNALKQLNVDTNAETNTRVARAMDDCERQNYVDAVARQFVGPISLSRPVYSWSTLLTIVFALVETGGFAAFCMQPKKVRNLVLWTVGMFKSWRIDDWIEKKGGWEALVHEEKRMRWASLFDDYEVRPLGLRFVPRPPAVLRTPRAAAPVPNVRVVIRQQEEAAEEAVEELVDAMREPGEAELQEATKQATAEQSSSNPIVPAPIAAAQQEGASVLRFQSAAMQQAQMASQQNQPSTSGLQQNQPSTSGLQQGQPSTSPLVRDLQEAARQQAGIAERAGMDDQLGQDDLDRDIVCEALQEIIDRVCRESERREASGGDAC